MDPNFGLEVKRDSAVGWEDMVVGPTPAFSALAVTGPVAPATTVWVTTTGSSSAAEHPAVNTAADNRTDIAATQRRGRAV